MIIVDDYLRMIFVNEALIRLGRYGRGEIQGSTPDAIFPQEDLPYIMRQHALGQRYGCHRNEFYFPRSGLVTFRRKNENRGSDALRCYSMPKLDSRQGHDFSSEMWVAS